MNVKSSSGFRKYFCGEYSQQKEASFASNDRICTICANTPQTTFLVRGDSIHGTESKTYVDFETKEDF